MKYIIILLAMVFCINLANAEDVTLEVDIAQLEIGSVMKESVTIREDIFLSLDIKNLLPSKRYKIKAGIRNETIPPYETSLGKHINNCNQVYQMAKMSLMDAKTEIEIPEIVSKYASDAETSCLDASEVEAYKDSLMLMTEYIAFIKGVKIRPGEKLVIEITREAQDAEKPMWTIEYEAASSESGGDWFFSYGFAFPLLMFSDELYHTMVSDSIEGRFEIAEKKRTEYTRFLPAVFISWQPNEDKFAEWTHSLTGGIGFDFENPVVFAGGALTYNQNLSFVYGLVAHKVTVLRGKYNEGQLVKEILDHDQLHEQAYRVNLFVGLTFRFD